MIMFNASHFSFDFDYWNVGKERERERESESDTGGQVWTRDRYEHRKAE